MRAPPLQPSPRARRPSPNYLTMLTMTPSTQTLAPAALVERERVLRAWRAT